MIRKIFNLLLPLLVLCAGCTKENMDDCDSGLQLHFSHSLNPYNEDRFHSDVNKLSIFVFDSNDVFYDLFVIDDPAMLGHDNSINLPLPEGTWDIVTWGGDMITYGYGTVTVTDAGHTYNHDLVKGETSLEDFRLWINNFTDREDGGILLTEDLSRLYYGRLSGVEIVQGSTTYGEVAMVLNTNTLRINIKGLSNLNMRGASDFNVAADMINGRYRADNQICKDARHIRYQQNGGVRGNDDDMQVDLTVKRLFVNDNTSEITIASPVLEGKYPEGKITIPIIGSILESPEYFTQEDLDRYNLFIFDITFDNELNISLTINGWEIVNVIPEI